MYFEAMGMMLGGLAVTVELVRLKTPSCGNPCLTPTTICPRADTLRVRAAGAGHGCRRTLVYSLIDG